jgi:diacylglycerol O-acyltransferase / wax synthase
MTRLNTQDASFLMMESPDTPMHIGFMLTFKLPKGAPADYMQKLHAKLERFAVDVEPFNLKLAQKEGFGKLAPEWVVDDNIDLGYHLRHEALPAPHGERELGLVISRLHSQPLERSRPLWECTLIEGLQPDRFALYLKIHHSLVDGIGLMQRMTHILAESPRGLSLPPWSAPAATTEAPPKPTQSADEEWRRLFEGLLAGMGKAKSKDKDKDKDPKKASSMPRGPRCILNGPSTGRRRFATQRLELARIKAISKAAEATVNDVVLAVCAGALRTYLAEVDHIPKPPLMATIPVALPKLEGQTIGNSVAAIHAEIATDVADAKARLLSIRDAMRESKDNFNRLPVSVNRIINSLGMLVSMAMPKKENTDPDKSMFTNLTVSNVPGPKQKLYFHGAEMDGMYPVSVLAGDHRLNITVLGYDEHLFFGLIACPDVLPHMQRLAVMLPAALDELEQALGLARRVGRKAPAKAKPAARPSARRLATA